MMKKQTGVVLIISLVMLILLTLIGLTGMQTTSLEEKMAGNAKDRNLAFQAAESTLLEAEKYIQSSAATYPGGGLWSSSQNFQDSDFFDGTISWNNSDSKATTAGFGNNFGLSSDPRYIIEKINTGIYRITARAVGNQPGTQVILQEVFAP